VHSYLMRTLQRLGERNRAAHQRLEGLNPHSVLQRGYSIVQKENGHVVTEPADVTADEALRVRTAGGSYQVRVDGAHSHSD
jgi:exodeoxyribonuclease VII large subunit